MKYVVGVTPPRTGLEPPKRKNRREKQRLCPGCRKVVLVTGDSWADHERTRNGKVERCPCSGNPLAPRKRLRRKMSAVLGRCPVCKHNNRVRADGRELNLPPEKKRSTPKKGIKKR